MASVNLSAGIITLRMFGAAGDGITDDVEAMKTALRYSQVNKDTIDGEILTYFVSGKSEITLNHFLLKNINFVTSKKYADQFSMKVDSEEVYMLNVNFDGGRGTYKTDIESWKDFAQESNVVSIYPVPDDLFYFVSLKKESKMLFEEINMKNIHASSCLTVITFGTVYLNNLYFKNISNKTYHVYHSVDEGKYQYGKTIVGEVFAEDIGIFPQRIKVNNKVINHQNIQKMPQASFNFIVSFGEYYLKKATVKNYGSSGVTSDRNTIFKSELINIENFSNKTFSNNPSAAMWFEGTSQITMEDVIITIRNRDSRDLLFDSSAFHIFGINSVANINNLTISGNMLNKGLRGSFIGKNNIRFNNIVISGNYKQAVAMFAMMPLSKIETKLSFGKATINGGTVEFYGVKEVEIDDLIGVTGKEQINFKLPDSSITKEKYRISRSNVKNIFKNDVIENIEIFDVNLKEIQTKKLN